MKWLTASEGGSHATQSSQSKVTLALSKETARCADGQACT